ncbi:MAG: hypothetical protein ACHQLQ_01830 [Candidatus Acidiferrales bacterium]
MPNVTYRNKSELVLHIEETDSMGRSEELVKAMEQNDPKARKPGKAEKVYAALIAQEHGTYPRVLYRLALKGGKPAGDVANPDYPLPVDTGLQIGFGDQNFKIIGKTKDSPGNFIVRLPWITRLCGVIREDKSIDLEASKAEEKKLLAAGWVYSPSQIKGLPVPPAEQEFDELPDEKPSNGARSA